MSGTPQNPNQAIDAMGAVTVAHVVLMIVLAAAAVLVIWYGAVLRRRRKRAETQVAENFVVAEEHGATCDPAASVRDNETATLSADVPEPTNAAPAGEGAPQAARETAPASVSKTEIADNLAQIKGLGPKLAALLAERGITRVAQLAALQPDEAAALDRQLGTFQGRMARDRWIEQAQLISAGDRPGYEAAFGKLGG